MDREKKVQLPSSVGFHNVPFTKPRLGLRLDAGEMCELHGVSQQAGDSPVVSAR